MIRAARPSDIPQLLHFIHALARFEKLEDQLATDAKCLEEHLFGPQPVCGASIAEDAGKPVGFALWFLAYSTFKTQPYLHLEDLFVLPEHRGGGHGQALLRGVAAAAVARGCPRLEWSVLDWNDGAIAFYHRHGAQVMSDWRLCRITGSALRELAEGASPHGGEAAT